MDSSSNSRVSVFFLSHAHAQEVYRCRCSYLHILPGRDERVQPHCVRNRKILGNVKGGALRQVECCTPPHEGGGPKLGSASMLKASTMSVLSIISLPKFHWVVRFLMPSDVKSLTLRVHTMSMSSHAWNPTSLDIRLFSNPTKRGQKCFVRYLVMVYSAKRPLVQGSTRERKYLNIHEAFLTPLRRI